MASWSSADRSPYVAAQTQAFPYAAGPRAAYTPVQVRTSFGYSQLNGNPSSVVPSAPPPPPSEQADAPRKKINWPDSVRSYVQRSFMPENLDNTVSRTDMEEQLKQTISRATDSGTMYKIDWDSMPLPQAIIREERQKALVSQAPRPPVDSHLQQPLGRHHKDAPAQARKRKSTDLTDDDESSSSSSAPLPPWRTAAHLNGHRAPVLRAPVSSPKPEKRRSTEEPGTPEPRQTTQKMSKFQKQLEKRQRRADGGYRSAYRSPSPPASAGPVVGTCEELEKRFLRLTAPPKPEQVRPERVLRRTLELLLRKWRAEENYHYICDQFKSLRQDLTVQRIRNDFTVNVYEMHARIALGKGDLGEYNQCQTQLMALYRTGLQGNPAEFKAYRILYFIHTQNKAALNEAVADLTPAEKEEQPIKHALGVRSSLALGNYHRFFSLYIQTPNMGAYLMDCFVERERLAALCCVCKAYRPDVKIRLITEELGFENDIEATQFVVEVKGDHLLEERGGDVFFLTGKAGSYFEAAKRRAFGKVDIKGQI